MEPAGSLVAPPPAAAPPLVPSEAGASAVIARRHRRLRLVLAIWVAAYPVVSCVPVVAATARGGVDLGVAALLVAATFLVPWLVGLLVIGILFLLAG